MLKPIARTLLVSSILALVTLSTACVDQARTCGAALSEATRARAEAEVHDRRIAWLVSWQGQLAAQQRATAARLGDESSEALRIKVAALETENAMLSARLERAERRLSVTSQRRLDTAIPYAFAAALTKPRSTAKHPPADRRARIARTLDETMPYDMLLPATAVDDARSGPRTLDEHVPY